MPRRRASELTGDTVVGDPRIPYDQTDPMVQVAAPQPGVGAPAEQGAPPTGAPMGQPPAAPQDLASLLGGLGGQDQQQGQGLLGQLGGGMGQNTDQLTGADLGAMGGDVGSPEEIQVAQLEEALNDPNTPPEVIQAIEQQLAMAARRRLAGVGQPSMGGNLGA